MIDPLPEQVGAILEEGSLCYLAARSPAGPHVTPLVYVTHASRIWITTSRRSVKARLWRREPSVGGLVRLGDSAVTFAGSVRTYDLLDPRTWPASVLSAPTVSLAAAAFTRRNARFFAGYAVDAPRVPLAWSPPGRVFVQVDLESAAVVGDQRIRRWGVRGARTVRGLDAFRPGRAGRDPLTALPADIRDRVGVGGEATLAVEGPRGIGVLPVRWGVVRGSVYAGLSEDVLALAGPRPEGPGSLVIDRSSAWRARAMTGAMLRGRALLYAGRRLRAGGREAGRILRSMGLDPAASVLVHVVPTRLVWWRGWTAGTVVP